MVLKRDRIVLRLEELDTVLTELRPYQNINAADLVSDIKTRWIIERGLIAAAALILDIANHILSAHFGQYTQTYAESLAACHQKGVISSDLYAQIKGLGGFRNILVHLYQEIDPNQVTNGLQTAVHTFPQFAREIFTWLDQNA